MNSILMMAAKKKKKKKTKAYLYFAFCAVSASCEQKHFDRLANVACKDDQAELQGVVPFMV